MATTNIVARPGILVRLTRNLDKKRGYVNGAIGEIVTVLSDGFFTVRLKTGTMVLVHPICGNREKAFVPCTYGYATTIRRAQGMSLSKGCVYFDLNFPPERGYAYVAVSRFRTRAGVYHFGRYRRTDWLPVGMDNDDDQTKRSIASMSSDSSQPYGSDSDSSSNSDITDSVKEDSDENSDDCMFDEENNDHESEDDDGNMFETESDDSDDLRCRNMWDNHEPEDDEPSEDLMQCLLLK